MSGDALRSAFVRRLTVDSSHRDRRRKDYNQAIFMDDGGAVWSSMDLAMVLRCFDDAVRDTTPACSVTDLELEKTAEKDKAVTSEPLARYDLRLRSLDRQPGDPISLCCAAGCQRTAVWSVWLHTPDWGPQGGATLVRCHRHAFAALRDL